MGPGTASMDITGGTMIIDGNAVDTINGYINEPNEWITAYSSLDDVVVDYNNINPGKTTVKAYSSRWDGGAADNNWSSAENWYGDVLPSNDAHVLLTGASAEVVLNSSQTIEDLLVHHDANLMVTSDGTLNSNSTWKELIISQINENGQTGTLIMDGGTINWAGNISIGRDCNSNGILQMDSGTINTTESGSYLYVGRSAGATGHVQLDGGTINVKNFQMGPGTASMDITGGTMIIDGNAVDTINGYINEPNEWITAYGGDRIVVTDYNSTTNETVVEASTYGVIITVDRSKTVNTDIVGIGWNIRPRIMPTRQSERDEFFQYLEDAQQSYLRIILNQLEWEDANDDANRWSAPTDFIDNDYNDSKFQWNDTDAGLDDTLIYLLDWCESHDVWVELSNWHADDKPSTKPDFYSNPSNYHTDLDTRDDYLIDYNDFVLDADEFGENIAALIYYLKTAANNGNGYECIKYHSIWNEQHGGVDRYSLVNADYPGSLNQLSKAVYDHLSYYDNIGGTDVVNNVQSIGLEGPPFWRNSKANGHPFEHWYDMIGIGVIDYNEPPDGITGEITCWPDGDPYMDAISIHDYYSVFDYDPNNPSSQNHRTLKEWLSEDGNDRIKRVIEQIAQYDLDGVNEPVFINEFGSMPYADTSQLYNHSLYIAEGIIRLFKLNAITGISRWAYNTHPNYAAISFPGVWYETAPKGIVHPIDRNYYPYLLLTQNIKRHSDVLDTQIIGNAKSDNSGSEAYVNTQRIFASAFVTQNGPLRLIIVNDSYQSKVALINLGQGTVPSLVKYYVTVDDHNDILVSDVNIISEESGTFEDTIAPRSINVFVEQNMQAHSPSPADFASDIAKSPTLSWTPGYWAADTNGHDVYLGTDYDTVADANHSSSEFKGNQDSNSYNASSLNYNTTYYWAIDEVNYANTWKGNVWSFTVDEGIAKNPSPSDNAIVVDPNDDLSWTAANGTNSHDVYFGTSFSDVNNATDPNTAPGKGNQATTIYDPGTLSFNTTYYWRIDEHTPEGTIKGNVWSFIVVKPVAWYKFDEISGTTANDSSGNDYHATVDANGSTAWDANGYNAGCLNFDSTFGVEVPNSVFTDINEAITISVWVYGDACQPRDDVIFRGHDSNDNPLLMSECPMSDGRILWQATGGYNTLWTNADSNDYKGGWDHYAFVNHSKKKLIQIYHDGELVAGNRYSLPLAGISDFKIGISPSGILGYKGKLDDFRIYKDALTEDGIKTLAGY
jgi:hypothetical protein